MDAGVSGMLTQNGRIFTVSTTITHSGRMVDLLNVTPEDIKLSDISWALAHINRFYGHASRSYSVAEHSINVARLLPEPIKIYGLLHDAHEAYIGDLSTPMKQALARQIEAEIVYRQFETYKMDASDEAVFEEALSDIERPIIAAIHQKLGVPWPVSPHVTAAVKWADVTMVQHELRQLFPERGTVPPPELPMPRWCIGPLSWYAPSLAYHFEAMVLGLSDDLRAAA